MLILYVGKLIAALEVIILTTEKTSFENGKNLAGKSHAGAEGLISAGPRTSPTQSKYQVSSDTISASDLQPSVESSQELSNKNG
ncbi:hypothetical protein SATMO3_40610 [Sporomusa aerivorans]